MDKPGKTYGNIVSDTLTFMDYMGLSMAASDNPQLEVRIAAAQNRVWWTILPPSLLERSSVDQ